MVNTEFDRVRKKLFTNAFSQKRKCLLMDCKQPAILSHVIQRKGILNHFISNNHLYEVSYLQYPEAHYVIKKIGWKDAMTFRGLCATHDCNVFKSIENGKIDFNDYNSMLLLSYRPMLHEFRLREIVIEVLRKIVSHSSIGPMVSPLGMQILMEAQTLMQWDLEFMLQCLKEDLNTDSNHYQFYLFSLPKIDVCTSIIFSYKSLADSFITFPEINIEKKEPIANILFHLIPCETETKLIIGYLSISEKHLKPRIEFLKSLDTQKLLKEVSDTLIRSCGTWVCSEAFYQKSIKQRETKLISLMNYFTLRKQFSTETIDLNLFDYSL